MAYPWPGWCIDLGKGTGARRQAGHWNGKPFKDLILRIADPLLARDTMRHGAAGTDTRPTP